MHFVAPLMGIAKIDIQVSKLTEVIETLKLINNAECFKLLKEVEPS
jgi:hypothetical protein